MRSAFHRAFRKIRFGEPVIVVSGLPRSGTSMAMKMLEAAGLALVVDGIREADIDNPKGYFELERIKDLANIDDKSFVAEARGKVIKVISYLLKELPASNNYKVIFMRRELDEVLASQAKMLNNRGEESSTADPEMKEIFENYLWRADYLLKNASHFEVLQLHYSGVLSDPLTEAKRIALFLGRDLDVEKMASVVDPELYRNRSRAAESAGEA